MISNKIIKVENPKWDRCSRNGFLRIGAKRTSFHTIAPLLISHEYDLIPYLDNLKLHSTESTQARMMTFRVIDAETTIKPFLQSVNQTSIDGKLAFQFEKDLIENTPIIIDPCTEYTWYTQFRKTLSKHKDFPREIRNLATKLLAIQKEVEDGKITKEMGNARETITYEKFWLDLVKDPKSLVDVVTKMLGLQHALGADIGLPPVPAVYSPELLQVAIKINSISQAIWAGENCATYIILTPQWMKSEGLIDLLINYLKSVKSKFIVLKIKNAELEKVSYVYQRKMFKKILEAINGIKHDDEEDKIFMLLEAGYLMYPAIAGGFDFVSTSLRGLDKDGGSFGDPDNEGRGGFFDPTHLVILPWRDISKILKNGRLPCTCEVCRGVTSVPKKKEWNKIRRMHYMLAVSRLFQDINQFVIDKKMELAVGKLSKSALSNFKTVIPFIS